jgi:hypothetical protein
MTAWFLLIILASGNTRVMPQESLQQCMATINAARQIEGKITRAFCFMTENDA